MKIDGQKPDQVDKPDDSKRTDESSKKDAERDFKRLLERKKGDKEGQSSPEKPPKSGNRGSTCGKQARRSLGARKQSGPASTFGERLKDGKLQLGQQSKQRDRLGTERHTERHLSETRLEHRHRKSHHRQVHHDHSTKRSTHHAPARPGGAADRPKDAVLGLPGTSTPVSPDSVEAPSHTTPVGAADPTGASRAEGAAPRERAVRRAEVAELARKLVDRAHVGHDASGRQIMLLDLEVPGRGNVRVRLRRRGDGFELRMRPENDELARDLRHEREHFRQSAADNGVDFTSIEVV